MIHLALVHHPVTDKRGDLVTTAVTNIDIHDIARSCRTFGVGRFWIVTPVPAMHALVERILAHWREGWGADYNPTRRDALETVRLANDLEEVVERARPEVEGAGSPLTIATSARPVEALPTLTMRQVAAAAPAPTRDLLFVFGTGNGLAGNVFGLCDAILPAIDGGTGFNHLSVRSAVAIYLAGWAEARRAEATRAGASSPERPRS